MTPIRTVFTLLSFALLSTLPACTTIESANNVELDSSFAYFQSPPASARPRVWWHWIDANVSREGITKDLEWMERVGIAGFHHFHVSASAGTFVDEPVTFGSDAWRELLQHSLTEADRLGLESTVHLAGGWSVTGGPWVRPDQAMKKYVWSETPVSGPSTVNMELPEPPSNPGVFQDMAYKSAIDVVLPRTESPTLPKVPFEQDSISEAPTFYRDSKVFAVRKQRSEIALAQTASSLTTNSTHITHEGLRDGRVGTGQPIDYADGPTIITELFEQPVEIGAVTLGMPHEWPTGRIELSVDGEVWEPVADIPGYTHLHLKSPARTFAFHPQKALGARVVITSPVPHPIADQLTGIPAPQRYTLSELVWRPGAVDRFEAKAGFEMDLSAPRSLSGMSGLAADAIVDLTDLMNATGQLNWEVPEGEWIVIRLGYSLTGKQNHPSPVQGRGLEVDKLNADHVNAYLEGFKDTFFGSQTGPLSETGLDYVLLDSWEAGLGNWTETILDEFESRRGYDPDLFLPVLTGRLVGNYELSQRFLDDWRTTLSDLVETGHNQTLANFAKANGIGVYGETPGVLTPTIADSLNMKALVDIPMAEFWYAPPGDPGNSIQPQYTADIREAASLANILGGRPVAAEAFTTLPIYAPWGQGPREMKWIADYYLAEGVNLFIIHSADHQPLDSFAPGFTLWQFGQFMSRNDTWAEQSKHWIDYLARTSYLLQQGTHVADVLVLLGETPPVTPPYWTEKITPVPNGLNYDFINARLLQNATDVENGQLVVPSSAKYKTLVVPNSVKSLSRATAERLSALAEAGMTVLIPSDLQTFGLHPDYAELEPISQILFGQVEQAANECRIMGLGRICITDDAAAWLASEIEPDVIVENSNSIRWTHRKTDQKEIYFVANSDLTPVRLDLSLRPTREHVELWFPETGQRRSVDWRRCENRTCLTLPLAAQESVFLVLSDAKPTNERRPHRDNLLQKQSIEENWALRLSNSPDLIQAGESNALGLWNESPDPNQRYHSGTGTYTASFDVDREAIEKSDRIILDLGIVGQIAEVSINGEMIGADWMPPYRLDVSQAIQSGENEIEIAVTNLWANQLISDSHLPPERRKGQAIFRPYTPATIHMLFTRQQGEHPLFESGLAGPITLEYRVFDREPAPEASGP